MAQTLTEVLTAAMDSVELINGVNGGSWDVDGMSQTKINEIVKRNVEHLEIILAYEPVDEDDETPDIVGDSSDKSSHTDAIATGNTYIKNNS